MLFSEATAAYLETKKLDNALQTIVEKGRTYKDFAEIYGDLEINTFAKAQVVTWKTLDIKRGLGENRINKRLGQLNDFFNWAITHGTLHRAPDQPRGRLVCQQQSQTCRQDRALRSVHQRRTP
jgi:site-specific recombinase XerC